MFLNTSCHFQDQGGITIGDGTLIGHNVVLATLNHNEDPERRNDTIEAAGAVVTKDVPPNMVVGGVPAKLIRPVRKEEP